MVVVPVEFASDTSDLTLETSDSRVANLVFSTVLLIPPAVYFSPCILARNSELRSPAKTKWLWLSTNPGITH